MRRPLVRLTALLLLCGSAFVAIAPPCLACGCVPQTPKQVFRRADAAFVGEVTSQRSLDAMTTAQTFRVNQVYKGLLHSTVDVVASMGAAGGSDCAILFPEGSRVAVVLQQQGDHWISDACSLLTLAELRQVAPSPQAPLPGEGVSAGGTTEPPTSGSAGSGGSGSGGISVAAVLAGGLLAIAAIAFVLSLESRRAARERRGREPDGSAPELGGSAPEGSAPPDAGPDAADPPEPSG